MDGSQPWRQDDGSWSTGCPWPELEDAVETLTEYGEMKALGDPVKTSRVPWITATYREAMRFCRMVTGG